MAPVRDAILTFIRWAAEQTDVVENLDRQREREEVSFVFDCLAHEPCHGEFVAPWDFLLRQQVPPSDEGSMRAP